MRLALQVILALLAGAMLLLGAGFAFLLIMGRGELQASNRRAREEMRQVTDALEAFDQDCGRYPTTEEGLNALRREPPYFAFKWHGPYLNQIPENDVRGHPYVYRSKGGDRFTCTSAGEDDLVMSR